MSKAKQQRANAAYWKAQQQKAVKHLLCTGYRRAVIYNKRLSEHREVWVRIVSIDEVKGSLMDWAVSPYGLEGDGLDYKVSKMEQAIRDSDELKCFAVKGRVRADPETEAE